MVTDLPSLVERIAREACAADTPDECNFLGPADHMYIDMSPPDAERFLARFAQLVAADIAAQLMEMHSQTSAHNYYHFAANEIRERFGVQNEQQRTE